MRTYRILVARTRAGYSISLPHAIERLCLDYSSRGVESLHPEGNAVLPYRGFNVSKDFLLRRNEIRSMWSDSKHSGGSQMTACGTLKKDTVEASTVELCCSLTW